jgi:hypothetical protein
MPNLQVGDPTRPPLVALQEVLFSKRSSKSSRRVAAAGSPVHPVEQQQQGGSREVVGIGEPLASSNPTGQSSLEQAEKSAGEGAQEQGWLAWGWGQPGEAVQSL